MNTVPVRSKPTQLFLSRDRYLFSLGHKTNHSSTATIMGLLKNLDPLLTADVLHILRSMGHGDKVLITDINFPAAEVASKTTTGKHVILTTDLPPVIDAICSVLPLDYFSEHRIHYMSPDAGIDLPGSGGEVKSAFTTAIRKHSDSSLTPIERMNFYEESRKCFAVIQTHERRPYANIILQKGVVGPDGGDLKP